MQITKKEIWWVKQKIKYEQEEELINGGIYPIERDL